MSIPLNVPPNSNAANPSPIARAREDSSSPAKHGLSGSAQLGQGRSPSSASAWATGSAAASSLRQRVTSKSIGFTPAASSVSPNANVNGNAGAGTSANANGNGNGGENSWRDRERDRERDRSASLSQGQSPGRAQAQAQAQPPLPAQSQSQSQSQLSGRSLNAGRPGPERTVGGFERRDRDTAAGERDGAGLGNAKAASKDTSKEKEKEKDGDGKNNLSHVPCRFFKAGTCTAGASCPFSHAAGEAGKREVCQWFLKGNCKFGHKCALAHVRPGEPMSMDRKNKKDAQREAREREGRDEPPVVQRDLTPSANGIPHRLSGSGPRPNLTEGPGGRPRFGSSVQDEQAASPVPIKSALSTSMNSPPVRLGSSPMREPFGPPSGATGSPSAGFGNLGRSPAGQGQFASSPNRPSPLAGSFSGSARQSVPGPLSLKASSTVGMHSPLRPPPSAPNPNTGFSSSFSHPSLLGDRDRTNGSGLAPPLSASFADSASALRKNIWARSETPEEPLSPRRRHIIHKLPRSISNDVFADDDDDDDDHGESFLPSSLSDLLTPMERARRNSRRDSSDSFGVSPRAASGAIGFGSGTGSIPGGGYWGGPERLAQSAGATMGPPGSTNFLQSLWSVDGNDARRRDVNGADAANSPAQYANPQSRGNIVFGAANGVEPGLVGNGYGNGNGQGEGAGRGIGFGSSRQSLLSQRAPSSQQHQQPTLDFPLRTAPHPSSPSARALQEHAPGQSLPGGLASALSRIHLHGPKVHSHLARGQGEEVRVGSGMGSGSEEMERVSSGERTPPAGSVGQHVGRGREEHDEGLFDMDG